MFLQYSGISYSNLIFHDGVSHSFLLLRRPCSPAGSGSSAGAVRQALAETEGWDPWLGGAVGLPSLARGAVGLGVTAPGLGKAMA